VNLDRWRAEYLAEDFSGVVAIAERGEVVDHLVAGEANRSDAIPNALDTRFAIASGSKLFTALTVCRLVESGRLGLDTKLRECVPADLLGGLDDRITLEHLLTHTSGITSYFEEDVDDDYEALWHDVPMYRFRRPHDFLPLFVDKPAKFAPGDRFEYNDSGFVLLGLVVEEVTGTPFAEAVRRAVFEPAGMVDSGYFEADRLPARTAQAYLPDPDGGWRSNVFSVPIVGGGDGGAHSTAPDLARLWHALHTHGVIGEEMTREVFRPRIATGLDAPRGRYGLGVWFAERFRFVEGGDPGIAMISGYSPERDASLTVIANVDTALWKAFLALWSEIAADGPAEAREI
jgi:CubicO group peptidase (beta-lactamase class C family)